MRWTSVIVFALASACQHAAPVPPSGHTNEREAVDPQVPRKVVTDTSIEILPAIKFDGLTSQVVPEGLKTLDAVAATLDGNPSILVVEVQAFGGDGDPKYQQVIGEQRARAIVDYLVKRGVSPKRLRSRGIAQAPGGQDNRPVFEILSRKE